MNHELTAPSILSLFDTTKEQRQTFAAQFIDSVMEGRVDALQAKIQLKCMADIIASIEDNPAFKECVADAAAKYGRGKHTFHNCTFEVKATAGRYDYSHDAEWSRMKEAIKGRETFMKSLTEPLQQVTPDGEVVEIQPAKYTPGADQCFITLK